MKNLLRLIACFSEVLSTHESKHALSLEMFEQNFWQQQGSTVSYYCWQQHHFVDSSIFPSVMIMNPHMCDNHERERLCSRDSVLCCVSE